MYRSSRTTADCLFFHVVFYPDRRLTVQCYKKFTSGPPADGSQRVKMVIRWISARFPCLVRNMDQLKICIWQTKPWNIYRFSATFSSTLYAILVPGHQCKPTRWSMFFLETSTHEELLSYSISRAAAKTPVSSFVISRVDCCKRLLEGSQAQLPISFNAPAMPLRNWFF